MQLLHDAVFVLFLLFFLFLSCVILVDCAWNGGWHPLAQHYRAFGKPNGKRFCMQSACFGVWRYRGLSMRVAESGLYIALSPMHRLTNPLLLIPWLAHPPLLIPWSALHVLSVNDGSWRRGWLRRNVTLAVGMPEIAQIRLPLRVVTAAEDLQYLQSAEGGVIHGAKAR
jgi:hypothetical protein